jgi:hypothetical protein
MPDTIAVVIYSRPGCHLCDDMKALVERVVRDLGTPAHIDSINIDGDAGLERAYGLEIPVLVVAGKKIAKYRVTEETLRRVLATR